MDAKQRLSDNIRKAYEKCGKSQRQIARETGQDRTTIIRWINGTYIPNALSLKIFCDAVGTSITEIYKGV